MGDFYFMSHQERKTTTTNNTTTTSSDLQIFVPKPKQEEDVLFISRKHFLSALYTKNIQGKRLPFYRFVQQSGIGMNLVPNPPIPHQLQIYTKKTNGSVGVEELAPKPVAGTSKVKSKPLPSDISVDDYPIEAVPISFKMPNFIVPDDQQLVAGQTEENATLRNIGARSRKEEPSWLKNWNIYPRQRPNGRIDKYYYHKETNVMCRSLVEVDNYELYGISPRQLKKMKKEEGTENPTPQASASEGASKASLKRKRASSNSCLKEEDQMVYQSPDNSDSNPISKAKIQQTVEEFLREAHENQLNQVYAAEYSPEAPLDCSTLVMAEEKNAEVGDSILPETDGKDDIASGDSQIEEPMTDFLLMDIPIDFGFDSMI
ncbi:uncharacterized protein LOC8283242 isoform X1 [Ricinus communis]|nr:uncharacterized protein LOC8283242 isoform X1 [Ricinus communis]